MKYIDAPAPGQILTQEEAFGDYQFGDHGKEKTGFGLRHDSVDNPTSICGKYNAGDRLRESVNLSSGDSRMGATMGGDRNLVISDKPYALAEDTDCHILAVLEYRQGKQAAHISGFVSKTGAEDEDPKPLKVRDDTHDGKEYEVNRTTGHAAHKTYFWHMYRINPETGRAHAALTVEMGSVTPKTDAVFEKPSQDDVYFCTQCGRA